MNDATYFMFAWFFKHVLWRGRLSGAQHLPQRGPAVFVANHAGALGPIAVAGEVPLRLYPWAHWKMLDRQENPEYLRVDFTEKTLRLRQPLSGAVSRALSPLVVSFLRGVGCIPVFRGQGLSLNRQTWDASLAHLLAGHCLLVFPEDPQAALVPQTEMHGFAHGVLWLADLYHRATGRALPYYLAAVHPARRMVLSPALELSPADFAAHGGKDHWVRLFEQTIRGMLEREKT